MIKVHFTEVSEYTVAKQNINLKIVIRYSPDTSIFTDDYINQFYHTDLKLYDYSVISTPNKNYFYILNNSNLNVIQILNSLIHYNT